MLPPPSLPSAERRRAVLAQLPRMTRGDGAPLRVLLVDDHQVLTDLIGMALGYEGWIVDVAGSGEEALVSYRDHRPDAVVLDIMLPDLDGLDVLARMRRLGRGTPTLFLTARDSVDDRILGLTAGGDDYMTKPFSLEELVARLRALLRRSMEAGAYEDPLIVVGDLSLDENTYEVRRAGVPVALTSTEFELLRFFMRNPRRVLTRAQILDRVWHYDFAGRANIVDLYVSYLRRKLEQGLPPVIHTVRGVGYALRPSE